MFILKCPFCGYSESKVVDSRPAEDNEKIRRRRECLSCTKRFTTYELIEVVPFVVTKKDKTRESFDRNKITKGVLKACEKRPVSLEEIENISYEIESDIQNSMEREVPSTQIGEMIMDKLKDLDEVAYVRFASVYRQFADIDSFMDELKTMLKEKSK